MGFFLLIDEMQMNKDTKRLPKKMIVSIDSTPHLSISGKFVIDPRTGGHHIYSNRSTIRALFHPPPIINLYAA
jgi:hypothetical protein